MDALLATATASPAIQVNISAVVGYLILAALSFAGFTVVGILLSNKRKIAELWDIHLGARAIGPDGIPRWYTRDAALIEALGRVEKTLTDFTDTQRELIQELRLDRVERKARDKAGQSARTPGA